MTASELRLHPLSILFSLGGELRNLAIPVVFGLFAFRQTDRPIMIQLLVVLVVALVSAVWRYLSFRMRYDPGELVIRTGVIRRNERHIPYSRVQSIDSRRNAFHQIFGVVEVIIQTAGGDEPEAKLSVLPASAVDEIRSRVFRNRAPVAAMAAGAAVAERGVEGVLPAQETAAAGGAERRVLLRLRPRDLVVYGFIENRGMFLVLAAAGLLFEFGGLDRILENAVSSEIEAQGPARTFVEGILSGSGLPGWMILYGLAGILLLLVVVRLISVVWATVRMHDFTVTRVGDDLRVEYGLFTRIAGTIPMRRIQSVEVREGLAHRLFRRATVDVSTAGGGRVETRGQAVHEPLAPVIPAEKVQDLLRELWPDLDLAPAIWNPVHPKAHVRLFRSAVAGVTIVSALLFLPLGWWSAAFFVVFSLWSLYSARKYARSIKWTIHERVFATRRGWLARSTAISWLNKIQVVGVSESYFDRRHGMAQLSADTGGDGTTVSFLPRAVAQQAFGTLSEIAARTRFRW